ncbi:hypothetical protein GE21DRAFT_6791 [Neurospora crassa]|uniref:Uncharacterized protein n=1 Tax=Neurospora crassa (strain ATCC 24698 / 74-OR23-1A / CBS 708.71 / DSM 1257 / FGSC 987) TaxID=367110 RepID=Q7S098_NEUCR|nr:hypothetical protein NCU10037 [Neurospora crassa OR74A]EAA28730.1 hypothetical protein NCU10037 [Neurospora crassa OR74A]KHE79055.1 hypothetical protein GE21DRAFT_6791 [Neurospora crassa]|eukprot:XP_957966.1 hypothetical protein NCU10037 [Neurospora crassa OR74A]
MALTLPARWQSKNMIDGYLRHQWPPKTHLELRPSGLDCLIAVMRHMVSYLPQERRDLTLNWAKEGDDLAKSFWGLVWLDYDKAGAEATDVLRGKFLDEYSKNKTARNGNPPFQTLLDSPRAFMSDFWSQPEMLTLSLCMVCDREQTWYQVMQHRLRLMWQGDITLRECVNNIARHRVDESSDYPEMFTEFAAPEILPIRYLPSGHRVQNFYDQIRGFIVELYDFDDQDRYVVQEETCYRLIAVVKLRGTPDGHDAVRLYRPNGVMSGSCTETDYFPTSWTVSDSEPYTLVYARFELPDMYDFVRYPELPVDRQDVRDLRLANPQHGQEASDNLGQGTSGQSSQESQDTSSQTNQEASGTPRQSTSSRPNQDTFGNPSQDVSNRPS